MLWICCTTCCKLTTCCTRQIEAIEFGHKHEIDSYKSPLAIAVIDWSSYTQIDRHRETRIFVGYDHPRFVEMSSQTANEATRRSMQSVNPLTDSDGDGSLLE